MYQRGKRLSALTLAIVSMQISAKVEFELEVLPNPTQAPKGTVAALVNADGSNIVLYAKDKTPWVFHWNKQQGHTHLGLLNNRNTLIPMDISDDGRVVVGHNGGASFVWTQHQKMQLLPKLKRHFITTAISISGDGKSVVGYAGWQEDMSGFRWQIDGSLIELGTGKDKVRWRDATYTSYDGNTVVGTSRKGVYVWQQGDGIKEISDPEGCNFIPVDISHDGNTIGARCSVDSPIIWNRSHGFKTLPVPHGASSTMITAMSGDGTRFLGSTTFSGNDYQQIKKPILWLNEKIYFLDDIIRQQRGRRVMKSISVSNISSNGKVIVGGYKDNNGHRYPIKLTIKD